MANQQSNYNITNGGNGVHDGVFMCHTCDNRPFRTHMDLLRHLLRHHGQQPADAQAAVPPPPPANNEIPGDDSSDDKLVIVLDPQPPSGGRGAALPQVPVPPQGEPENGLVADNQVVNHPPQVVPAVGNGAIQAGTGHQNGHAANGAHD